MSDEEQVPDQDGMFAISITRLRRLIGNRLDKLIPKEGVMRAKPGLLYLEFAYWVGPPRAERAEIVAEALKWAWTWHGDVDDPGWMIDTILGLGDHLPEFTTGKGDLIEAFAQLPDTLDAQFKTRLCDKLAVQFRL